MQVGFTKPHGALKIPIISATFFSITNQTITDDDETSPKPEPTQTPRSENDSECWEDVALDNKRNNLSLYLSAFPIRFAALKL